MTRQSANADWTILSCFTPLSRFCRQGGGRWGLGLEDFGIEPVSSYGDRGQNVTTVSSRLALCVGTMILTSVPATAQTDWTGFYAGIFGGMQGGSLDLVLVNPPNPPVPGELDGSGFLAGGTLGYNFHLDNGVVVGVEADLSYADTAFPFTAFQPGLQGFGNIGMSGSVRARLGYAVGDLLPFVTAGVTATQVEYGVPIGGPVLAHDKVVPGWTVGLGAEYAFTTEASASLEYRYSSYQTKADLDFVGMPDTTLNGTLDTHDVRLGVKYRF